MITWYVPTAPSPAALAANRAVALQLLPFHLAQKLPAILFADNLHDFERAHKRFSGINKNAFVRRLLTESKWLFVYPVSPLLKSVKVKPGLINLSRSFVSDMLAQKNSIQELGSSE